MRESPGRKISKKSLLVRQEVSQGALGCVWVGVGGGLKGLWEGFQGRISGELKGVAGVSEKM